MGLGLGGRAGSGLRAQEAAATAPAPGELWRPPPEGKHINLAGNENPFGPSPAVVRRILKAAPESCRYPFREEFVLKEMLARREGVPVENIALGNGCDELLALAAIVALGGKQRELVAAHPTYFQLPDYAENMGATVRWVPHRRDTMQHDLAAMAAAVGADTGLVYVCNPDNPSGTMVDAAELTAFCREVAPRAPVFLDEVYLELVDDWPTLTQVQLVRDGLPVMIGRSFSKMHGLAGHRIGYVVTTPELARRLEGRRMSSVNFIGVAAARESLFDLDFHRWTIGKIREGRERFYDVCDELGLTYTRSHGNFVFHRTGIPMGDYQEMMKARGFLTGWPHDPVEPYVDWCRVSIGTDSEMAQYAAAMRAVFAERLRS